MASRAYEIVIRVTGEDKASGPLGSAAGALGRVGEIAAGILSARVFEGIARQIGSLASQALSGAKEFQTLTIALEGLLAREIVGQGTTDDFAVALSLAAEPAEDLLNWIKQISVTTPFTADNLSKTVQIAMAMGFTSDEAKNLSLAVGNFTAGMGLSGETMERIIYNFGQMIQQGKVTGTELRDLARGSFVPVTDVLKRMQENLGLTEMSFEDFREQASAGDLPVEEFFKAFTDIATEQFPGAMERMSKTWEGVTSNIKDFIQVVLGTEIIGPTLDRVSGFLSSALDWLLSPDVMAGARRTGEALLEAFDKVVAVLESDLVPAIGDFLDKIGAGEMKLPALSDVLEDVGDAVAGFISWFSEAIVVVGDFLQKHGPFLKEVFLGIAVALGAILAVSGVASVIGGIAAAIAGIAAAVSSAGIVAVIAGIAAGIALLGLAWTNNWGGIRDILTEVWETYLLPAFTEIKAWLDTNLPMAIAFLSDLWTNTLLPAIQTVVEWATTTLFPVLAEIARVVGEVVTAALQAHANFWENVLKPAIEIVWGFISGSVIPLLLELSNVSRAILGVALTALAGLWQNVLQPALQEVWKFIKGSVIPVIEDVARVIKNVLGPPASWLANTVLSGMKRSLDNVSSSIRKIINWLRELASKIRSLKLPSWLTPGSPTPLELGLIGIEGALKKANRTMGRSPLVGANGMSATAGGSPGGSVNHIEINVSGSGDPEAVASAILRKLRQQGVVP